jgi:hypothetical protein
MLTYYQKGEPMKNVRALTSKDIGPYTISSKVFAVRLFRVGTRKWLGGILGLVEIDSTKKRCIIHFNGFVEVTPNLELELDPSNPGEELFVGCHLVMGKISYGGSLGNDRRGLAFADPQVVENDTFPPDILSIQSAEDGSAILSGRQEDVTAISQLLMECKSARV